VDILAWDSQTRILASQFTVSHPAEATATAWYSTGTINIAWRDGHVEAWSIQGRRWSADVGFEILWLLADENLGVYAFGPGRAVLIDPKGQKIGSWTIAGRPGGVLQTMGGDLYVWSGSGLWCKRPSESNFQLFDPAPQLLGVTTDRLDKLVLTEPNRLRRMAPDGSLLSEIPLPRSAQTAAVLDDRGRIVVGTKGGLELWAYDGRSLGILDPVVPASSLLLTDHGKGVWSDLNWKLHVWSGFLKSEFGWSQEGGGPGRAFSAHSPSSVSARAVDWADDHQFGYFWSLVSSGEEAKQSQVLDLLEAKALTGTLLSTWPFANVILLKIGRSGLTDLLMDGNRVANNWPGLRERAFALLSKSASPEDRNELLDLLQREFDPSVASQAARALAQSGWDGDGKLMRQLYHLLGRMADQPAVAETVIDSARNLWQVNGRSSDPILIPLITAIYQGPYPKSVKLKAQNFFQDLIQGQ